MTERGDELIQRILMAPQSAQDVANELLVEMNRGYPATHLTPLLCHDDEDVTEAAVWIVSELSAPTGPLVETAAPLIGHDRPAVRFFAIDVVLDNVADEGELLAATLRLVHDIDSGVRWKAMRFAMLADAIQLKAAVPFLSSEERFALRASGLLAEEAPELREEKASAGIDADDALLRRWSVSAAARLGSEALLEVASSSDDEDLSTFASRELARLRRFGPARRGPGV